MPRLPDEIAPVFERFVRGAGLVRAALDGVTAAELSRPGPEGWSVRDIVVHLADSELVRAERFRRVITEDNPELFDFDEGLWKRRLQYLWRSPEAALALFDALRFTNAELLRQFDGSVYGRTGIHPVDGALSVGALLERGAVHAEEHAAQMEAVRASLSGAGRP